MAEYGVKSLTVIKLLIRLTHAQFGADRRPEIDRLRWFPYQRSSETLWTSAKHWIHVTLDTRITHTVHVQVQYS